MVCVCAYKGQLSGCHSPWRLTQEGFCSVLYLPWRHLERQWVTQRLAGLVMCCCGDSFMGGGDHTTGENLTGRFTRTADLGWLWNLSLRRSGAFPACVPLTSVPGGSALGTGARTH